MEQLELNENSLERERFEFNQIYTEPEVEECCEDSQLKKISEVIGIDYYTLANIKTVEHNSNDLDCLHCKILNKIEELRKGIDTLSKELSLSEEILRLKQMQNTDIKSIIDRLETCIPQSLNNSEIKIEESDKICGCGKSCLVF